MSLFQRPGASRPTMGGGRSVSQAPTDNYSDLPASEMPLGGKMPLVLDADYLYDVYENYHNPTLDAVLFGAPYGNFLPENTFSTMRQGLADEYSQYQQNKGTGATNALFDREGFDPEQASYVDLLEWANAKNSDLYGTYGALGSDHEGVDTQTGAQKSKAVKNFLISQGYQGDDLYRAATQALASSPRSDDYTGWNVYSSPGSIAKQISGYLPSGGENITPEEIAAFEKQLASFQSQAVQAHRDEDNADDGGGFGGILGPLATIASFVPGLQPIAVPLRIAAGVDALANKNYGSALLNFAGAGGIGGSEVGNFFGLSGDVGKIAGSALLQGAGSALDGGDFFSGALSGGLTSGLSSGLSNILPSDLRWAATPLASVGSSLIRGKPITPTNLLVNAAMAYGLQQPQTPGSSTNRGGTAPRQAYVK